jgi:hypothetical protein
VRPLLNTTQASTTVPVTRPGGGADVTVTGCHGRTRPRVLEIFTGKFKVTLAAWHFTGKLKSLVTMTAGDYAAGSG